MGVGERLLVAPIFDPHGVGRYYLPRGRWVHWFSGRTVEGPGWFETTHDYFDLPLFLRPDHLVAEGSVEDRPDYAYAASVTVHLGALTEGATARAEVPDQDGQPARVIQVRREASSLRIRSDGPAALFWRGMERVDGAEGGGVTVRDGGAVVRWDRSVDDLVVWLQS